MRQQKLLLVVMLGHNTLTQLQDYIFRYHSNSYLGSLFYTALRCKKFFRIGPRGQNLVLGTISFGWSIIRLSQPLCQLKLKISLQNNNKLIWIICKQGHRKMQCLGNQFSGYGGQVPQIPHHQRPYINDVTQFGWFLTPSHITLLCMYLCHTRPTPARGPLFA